MTLASIRAAVVVAGVLVAASARADDIATKRMWFAEKGDSLVVSASFTELFDSGAYEALSSGFATTVVVGISVYEEASNLPVAVASSTLRVIYDLWDEEFLVRVQDARGHRNWRFKSRADALRALTEIDAFPLAGLARVAVGPRYYCVLVAQLNPVSEERLAQMRRWLTKRAGSASLDSDASFFGAFVSVFVNPELRGADSTLRLRSQPFFRVPRP